MKTIADLDAKELRMALAKTHIKMFHMHSSNITNIVKSNHSIYLMASDVFNYGIMVGKHIERQKKGR